MRNNPRASFSKKQREKCFPIKCFVVSYSVSSRNKTIVSQAVKLKNVSSEIKMDKKYRALKKLRSFFSFYYYYSEFL